MTRAYSQLLLKSCEYLFEYEHLYNKSHSSTYSPSRNPVNEFPPSPSSRETKRTVKYNIGVEWE